MAQLRSLNLENIFQVVIEVVLVILFFLVPLVLVTNTQELFEFNKMLLTYALAGLLLTVWLGKLISSNKPEIKVSPLWLSGIIFLGALTLSTIFSIDHHVSIFGYYGRFNGGLLSWIAYAIIFIVLTQQTKKFYLNVVKISVLSGVLVAGWGILEHFGIDSSYWVPDVKARVFSTIGQPDWLAAYLVMLLPWIFSFYLLAKNKRVLALLFVSGIVTYTCFIYTFSRGSDLGLIAAALVWIVLVGTRQVWENKKRLFTLALCLVFITIIFSSPLTSRISGTTPRIVTVLETGNETINTRLIVWRGALAIFRHYPLLGSGVETFGESFYQFRPLAMNQTSEWNFLFNKAHNEYLNYLATTGIIGTLAYLFLLGSFLVFGIKMAIKSHDPFYSAALAAIAGYLVQNIFSFTVVPLAILFILNIAILGIDQRKTLRWYWPKSIMFLQKYKVTLLILIPAGFILITVFNLWRADVSYTLGAYDNQIGASSAAKQQLTTAVNLNPTEPNYQIQLGLVDANLAIISNVPKEARQLENQALLYTNRASATSPDDLLIAQQKATIFQTLAVIDKSYGPLAEQVWLKTVTLAPTSPDIRVGLADYYKNRGLFNKAIINYKIAIALKPDYLLPLTTLATIYLDQGNTAQARKYLREAQKIDPNDATVKELSQGVSL